jgi:hypothetical protein
MNPARTFSPALAGGFWQNNLVYWLGPFVGAIIAALLYEYIILEAVWKGLGSHSALLSFSWLSRPTRRSSFIETQIACCPQCFSGRDNSST